MCVSTYVCIPVYIFLGMYVCMYEYINGCMLACMRSLQVCTYMFVTKQICVFIRMYIYVFTYMCGFVNGDICTQQYIFN